LPGIEIRVFPISRQQWIADGVGVRRIGNIHRTADRLVATTLRNIAAVRTGHVIYKFNSAVRTAKDRDDRLSRWVVSLQSRRHANVVAVAMANKIARMAWAIMIQDTDYDPDFNPVIAG